MSGVDDLAAGKAGEYLVCADLILKGHTAFPSEQGLPYDVIADIGGRLLKVQVKTTRGLRKVPQRKEHASGYLFHVTRCGKGGVKKYDGGDVDVFALVALDERSIGYLAASEVKRTMLFRSRQNEGKHYDEIIRERSRRIREMRERGVSFKDIALVFEMVEAVVKRICSREDEMPKGSPYLDELLLDGAILKIAANDNTKRDISI